MTENRKVQVALVIAGGALALSIYAVARGGDARPTGPNACVDQDARAQMAALRQALTERDAALTRMSRAVAAATAAGDRTAAGERAEPARRAEPVDLGPRRYVHFEIPNPSVTMTQKEDATFDIRTTDPSLAGTTMTVTAVTATGEEDRMMIRIPQ